MTNTDRRSGSSARRAMFGAGWFAAVLLATTLANAQGEARRVDAEMLFDDGRRLMAEGNFARACPKLAASQKLDPAIGTLMNLGDCYEKAGKTASAWASFREAAGAASAAGDARREQESLKRAAALRPRLSTLTVTASAPAAVEGLSVTIDKIEMDKAMLGTPVPLDPGSHTIGARAPGKMPWNRTMLVPAGATFQSVVIPELQVELPRLAVLPSPSTHTALQSIPPQRPAPAVDRSAGSSQRTVGLLVGGIGAATLVTGGMLAWSARSKWNDAKDRCTDNLCDSQADVQQARDARSRANVASVVIGGGALGVVGGAVLWFFAPANLRRPANANVRIAPVVALHSASILLSGGF